MKGPSMLVSITAGKMQRLKSGVGIGSITSLLDWGVGVAAMDGVRAKRASRGVRRRELETCILSDVKLKGGFLVRLGLLEKVDWIKKKKLKMRGLLR